MTRKCGGCNWETMRFYSFKGEEGKNWEHSLCSECMLGLIIDTAFEKGSIITKDFD